MTESIWFAPNLFIKAPHMKKWTLAFLMLCTFACKKDPETDKNTSASDSTVVDEKPADPTAEALAAKLMRFENKSFRTSDSIYFRASIIPASDSIHQILLLDGKARNGNRVYPFEESVLLRKQKRLSGKRLPGKTFLTESDATGTLRLYNYLEDTDTVQVFISTIEGDTVRYAAGKPKTNYAYQFLMQPAWYPEPGANLNYFFTHRDSRIQNDSLLKAAIPGFTFYRDTIPLFKKSLPLPVKTLLAEGDQGYGRILIQDTDTLPTFLWLNYREFPRSTAHQRQSRFESKNLLIQKESKDSLILDHPHLISYQRKEKRMLYQLDENFQWSVQAGDSSARRVNYPQYYETLKDTSFTLKSPEFIKNGQPMHWEYLVRYNHKAEHNDSTVSVILLDAALRKGRSLQLRIPLRTRLFQKPTVTSLLLQTGDEIQWADISADGKEEILVQEDKDRSGNMRYNVYAQQGDTSFTEIPGLGGSASPDMLPKVHEGTLMYFSGAGNGSWSAAALRPLPNGIVRKARYWTTKELEGVKIHYQFLTGQTITQKGTLSEPGKSWDWGNHRDSFYQWVQSRKDVL